MKYAFLAALALVFWPVQGTTHGWVWSTIMLTAIWRDWRHHHALP
jgi:hypothetical protein